MRIERSKVLHVVSFRMRLSHSDTYTLCMKCTLLVLGVSDRSYVRPVIWFFSLSSRAACAKERGFDSADVSFLQYDAGQAIV